MQFTAQEEIYLNKAWGIGYKVFKQYRNTLERKYDLMAKGYKVDITADDKGYAQAKAEQLRNWGYKAKAVKTYRAEDTYYWTVWYKY